VHDITELALRARDGDQEALHDLIHGTISDIHRFCGALVDAQSAEDLTQQTYLKAIQSLRRYRGEAPASAWLLSIARHTCIDEIRRRQRRRDLEVPGLTIEPTPHNDHAERVTIDAAINDLEPQRREVFVATQVIGLTYEETAEVLKIPVGTVRSRVYRARIDLMRALEPTLRSDSVTS